MHLAVETKLLTRLHFLLCRVGGSFYWDFVPPVWLFNILAGDANVRVRL